MCHKLTKDHVWLTSFTRMRVYLAAQVGPVAAISRLYSHTCYPSMHVHAMQVMSESVACALEKLDRYRTRETRKFIRMVDKFFDCLNGRGPKVALLKRKDDLSPYTDPKDKRFEV